MEFEYALYDSDGCNYSSAFAPILFVWQRYSDYTVSPVPAAGRT